MLKNGLSIAQLTGSANEMVSVETVLMHKSGEWISSTIEMPVMDQKGTNSAQSVGIIITYARRYAITAMFGICAQDDSDGNATSTAGKLITGVERDAIFKACNNNKDKIEGIMKWANISNINDLTLDKYTEVINNIKIQSMKEKNDVV